MTDTLLKLKVGYDLPGGLEARLTLGYQDHSSTQLHPETYLRGPRGNPIYSGLVEIHGRTYRVHSASLSLGDARNISYGLRLEGELGGGWNMEAVLSHYKIIESVQRSSGGNLAKARAGGPGTLTINEGSGWWYFNIKFGHRHDLGWLGQRVLFGYHLDRYVLDEARYATSNWREATRTRLLGDSEGTTLTQAVFIENEWWFGDAWSLVLGARYEWWHAYDGSLARDINGTRVRSTFRERRESHFSPKATLSFAPNSKWLARLSLGVAYRFPTVGELYQGQLSKLGKFRRAFDPNLKTEQAFAKNLMIKRFFDNATITLNLWHKDIENTILGHRERGVRTFKNIDHVHAYGIGLVVTTDGLWIDGLDLNFNVSYADTEILENDVVPASEGNNIPGVYAWRAKLFASYRVTDRLRVGGGVRYASDPYETLLNADGEQVDGFTTTSNLFVLEARASYKLGGGFTLSAGIDNITDEDYFSYHPFPGRTFFAELTWQY